MTQKGYYLNLDKNIVETADRLRGDLARNKYINEAVKAQNLRVAAKKRFDSKHKTQVENEVMNLEQHPEQVEQIVRMGAV